MTVITELLVSESGSEVYGLVYRFMGLVFEKYTPGGVGLNGESCIVADIKELFQSGTVVDGVHL